MQKMKYKCEKCNCKEANYKYQKESDTYLVKCLECKNKTVINPTPEEREKIEYTIRYYRVYTGIFVFYAVLFGSLIGDVLGCIINYYRML